MFMDGRTDGCAESRLIAISPESFGQGVGCKIIIIIIIIINNNKNDNK